MGGGAGGGNKRVYLQWIKHCQKFLENRKHIIPGYLGNSRWMEGKKPHTYATENCFKGKRNSNHIENTSKDQGQPSV